MPAIPRGGAAWIAFLVSSVVIEQVQQCATTRLDLRDVKNKMILNHYIGSTHVWFITRLYETPRGTRHLLRREYLWGSGSEEACRPRGSLPPSLSGISPPTAFIPYPHTMSSVKRCI
jgi:hypothetical protein